MLGYSAAGASTLMLAACTKAPSPDSPTVTTTAAAGTAASSSSAETSAAASSAAASPTSTAKVLSALSAVAVGSAIAAKGSDGGDIIIIHPDANTVKAFSAICPHQGCTVPPSFTCPCHGSVFDKTTGARIAGPAPKGLTTVPVTISGTNIVAG
jgi:Rieske Fe-S protein